MQGKSTRVVTSKTTLNQHNIRMVNGTRLPQGRLPSCVSGELLPGQIRWSCTGHNCNLPRKCKFYQTVEPPQLMLSPIAQTVPLFASKDLFSPLLPWSSPPGKCTDSSRCTLTRTHRTHSKAAANSHIVGRLWKYITFCRMVHYAWFACVFLLNLHPSPRPKWHLPTVV